MLPCLAAFCRVQLLTLVHCPRRTSNAAIQKRIVAVTNGVDFLEGCGFEHATEGGEEVLLMDEAKVNMELLNGAGSLLVGARDNPTFGML